MAQKMITVPVDDIVCLKVGSLAEYQEKCRRQAQERESQCSEPTRECEPTTFQAMFGLPAVTPMRMALGV